MVILKTVLMQNRILHKFLESKENIENLMPDFSPLNI